MAKKTVHVDGVLKKKIMKRPTKKKKTIHKVVDYLLSDCYLFAPIISPSPYNSSRTPTKGSSTNFPIIHTSVSLLLFHSNWFMFAFFILGIEIRERPKDNRNLRKKIEDYLKSDCYMYAPLLQPQSALKGTYI